MSQRNAALAYAAFEDRNLEAAAAYVEAAVEGGYPGIQQLGAVIAHQRGDYAGAIQMLETLEQATEASISLLIRLHLLAGDAQRAGQLLLDCCRYNAFGPPLYDVPRWQGEPLERRRIVVWGAGFGDDIMYVRYVPVLAERGAEVVVACRPALVRLFESLDGVSRVVTLDADVTDCDYHVQTAELVARFGIADDCPWSGAYLGATAQTFDAPGLRVGLVWASAAAHFEVADKSAALAEMTALASVPNATFYSLQVGSPQAQLHPAPAGLVVEDLAPQLRDFADTAAAIAGLDVVISIDTAVANLAGAMGANVWVAAPFIPDWRWASEGPTSTWFPTATVYRQPRRGDWRSVFEAMASDLKVLQVTVDDEVATS